MRGRFVDLVERQLALFMTENEGLIRDMKRHSYYEKPSDRKRRQSRKSIRQVAKEGEVIR